MIDVISIEAALFIPLVLWVLSFFGITDPFRTIDHSLMVVYLFLFLCFGAAHEINGCSKCAQERCPVSKVSRERRSKGH